MEMRRHAPGYMAGCDYIIGQCHFNLDFNLLLTSDLSSVALGCVINEGQSFPRSRSFASSREKLMCCERKYTFNYNFSVDYICAYLSVSFFFA